MNICKRFPTASQIFVNQVCHWLSSEISHFVSVRVGENDIYFLTGGGLYRRPLPWLMVCVEEWQGGQSSSIGLSHTLQLQKPSQGKIFCSALSLQWLLCVFNDADNAKTLSVVAVLLNVTAAAIALENELILTQRRHRFSLQLAHDSRWSLFAKITILANTRREKSKDSELCRQKKM